MIMLKKELRLQNPLRFMERENEDILPEGGMGAVLARAGVGKTAILVQLALNTLLKGKNVLHISLNDPVKKVGLWYKEVFRHLTKPYEARKINQVWESILPHRFIMTFRVEGFTTSKLEERLADLEEQDIFSPQMIFIDGFQIDDTAKTSLSELKRLAEKRSLHVWLTIKTHRHDKSDPNGMPAPLLDVVDLFDLVIQLQPEGKEIHVKTLKGTGVDSDQPVLLLDPSTMLLKKTAT
jgi:hypothetical protein